MNESIVVIEDDLTIRTLLGMALDGAGYKNVTLAERGDDGLEAVKRLGPELVLLDVMLPGLDGFAIAKRIRETPALATTRIIMLTARTDPEDIVRGLEAGADDYVTKPFDRKVLLARVKAVLRRSLPPAGALYDGLELDDAAKTAKLDGVELRLTAGEFEILRKLIAHRGRVLPRPPDARSLDVLVANLRRKLGAWADHIETIRGVGYRVCV